MQIKNESSEMCFYKLRSSTIYRPIKDNYLNKVTSTKVRHVKHLDVRINCDGH